MSFGPGPNRIWQPNLPNMMPQQNLYMPNNNFPSENYSANGISIAYPTVPANNSQPQCYNSHGTVSKVNNECGLINDEVFFYKSACKGYCPELGDRVMFEAVYSATGQFKWNAEKVQLMMPVQHAVMPTESSGTNLRTDPLFACMPPARLNQDREYREYRGSDERRGSERTRRSRDRDEDHIGSKRRREEHHDKSRVNSSHRSHEDFRRNKPESSSAFSEASRERQDRRDRDRKESIKEREKPERERSPYHANRAKYSRNVRHYDVKIPSYTLTCKEIDYYELRKRHAFMHIPSNFFLLKQKWAEIFTPDNPFSLNRPSQFFYTHKSIPLPFEVKKEEIDPADADHAFVVMLMLPTHKPINDIYKQCFEAEESTDVKQFLSFLVENNSKTNNKTMIGGPWSPSLDGQDPAKDPSVLIRTAIRVGRANLGIDLSKCAQWYRFCELYYKVDPKHQPEGEKCSLGVKTVVIFIPDLNSCMPTLEEWEKTRKAYQKMLHEHVARLTTQAANAENSAKSAKVACNTKTVAAEKSRATAAEPEAADKPADELKKDEKASTNEAANDSESVTVAPDTAAPEEPAADNAGDTAEEQHPKDTATVMSESNEKDNAAVDMEHSKVDVKTMKVQEIRDALQARNQSTKGTRAQLQTRLLNALNEEQCKNGATETEASSQHGALPEIKANDDEKNENTKKKNLKQPKFEKSEEKPAEDQEDWDNVNDVDMNDIVILDEYDSRRNPEEGLKGIDEAEKEKIIKRYTLPSFPCILIPREKQSNSIVRYSALFSSRSSFEIMIFAELFNDMLMRDFGLSIYRELYRQSRSEKSKSKKEAEKSKKTNGKNETDSNRTENEKPEEAVENHVRRSSKDKDDDTNSTCSTRKRKSNSEKEGDRSGDKKTVVVNPELLLAFLYFDTSRCGYILEKDLRELFSILGLRLTRGQINDIFDKLSIRQTFYYRKFTHKEESFAEMPAVEDIKESSGHQADLIKKEVLENQIPDDDLDPSRTVALAASPEGRGLVNHNGAVVDVEKLLDQIRRLEKSNADLEKAYSDYRKSHNDLRKEYCKATWKVENLESELKSLSSINRKYRVQQAAIIEACNLLNPLVNREKERDRDKERDRKVENSNSKDAAKREKDKETSKTDAGKEKESTKPKAKVKDNASEKKTNKNQTDVCKPNDIEQKIDMKPSDDNETEKSNKVLDDDKRSEQENLKETDKGQENVNAKKLQDECNADVEMHEEK